MIRHTPPRKVVVPKSSTKTEHFVEAIGTSNCTCLVRTGRRRMASSLASLAYSKEQQRTSNCTFVVETGRRTLASSRETLTAPQKRSHQGAGRHWCQTFEWVYLPKNVERHPMGRRRPPVHPGASAYNAPTQARRNESRRQGACSCSHFQTNRRAPRLHLASYGDPNALRARG